MKALVLFDATVVVSQRSLVITQGLTHASELFVRSANSGQRNGLHQTWWPDGREKSRLNFLHGKPQGWSLLYFANGQLDQKNLFEDGVMLSTQSWRDDGTPLHAVEYVDGRKHGLERRWGEDGTRTVCAWQDGSLLRPCSHF